MDRTQAFGQMLRTLRTGRDLTQEQLAELIDRSVQAISRMESGHGVPTLETLLRISDKLDIPLSELVAVFDGRRPVDPDRVALETDLLESARRLGLRDLRVLVKVAKAFPEQR